jgi:hypothetical protein
MIYHVFQCQEKWITIRAFYLEVTQIAWQMLAKSGHEMAHAMKRMIT